MKKLLFLVAAFLGVLSANAAAGDNLWNDASVTEQTWWYAPDWNKIADPAVTVSNGSYSFTLPTATTERWQAQYGLVTNISTVSSERYTFSCKITSSSSFTALVKLFKNGDDGAQYFADDVQLTAGQTYTFTKANMNGNDFDVIKLLFDFGGNADNTNITISDIQLIDEGAAQAAVAPTTTAPDPTVDASNVFSIYSDKYGNATDFSFYDWGAPTKGKEIKINGNNVFELGGLTYYGSQYQQTDVTNYDVLHLDVFANEDATIQIVPIWWNPDANANFAEVPYTANITGGQWNQLDIPASSFASDDRNGVNINYQMKFDGGNSKDFWVDNIYWYSTSEIPFAIGAADANGFTPVTGTVHEADLADIKALDVTALDITGATLDEGITKIETANPNTIIAVKGTRGENDDVISEQANQLTETKNLVLRDTYIFPVKQLELQDGHDAYSTFFISTGSKGYKISYAIGAKKYAGILTPAVVDDATLAATYPSLTVYDFDADNSNATEVKFTKDPILTAAIPHIVYNSSDADVTLDVIGTGDLNLATPESAKLGDAVKFNGTYSTVAADGTQFDIQGTDGAAPQFSSVATAVPAFHAYFTGVTAETNITLPGSETTGINSINAADADSVNAPAYNVAGQRVGKEFKGLVIKNGKKFINK